MLKPSLTGLRHEEKTGIIYKKDTVLSMCQ